jgi:hypothetical protein
LFKLYFLLLVSCKWIPTYVFNCLLGSPKRVHILFCNCDHFEPSVGNVSFKIEGERLTRLLTEYPKLVQNHRDFAGNKPKRTWFFPPHIHRNNHLKRLVSLCEQGYGEIELHLHHGKTVSDTPENLKETIKQCLEEYSYFGVFGTEDNRKRYAFIHGDWALDNSRKGRFCGVNNEIQILKETGCYADFTFPSINEANPIKINSVFYAVDDPKRPKSYNRGLNLRKYGKKKGDLMLIQGPLHPFFIKRGLLGLRVLGDSINGSPPTTEKRISLWVKTGIHIKGASKLIIIKTHTHGAADEKAALGAEMENIFSHLEKKYNDGTRYILHYVSARELYNIIKSVEEGESESDPERFRNYKVQPPLYDSSKNYSEASDKLKGLIAKTFR